MSPRVTLLLSSSPRRLGSIPRPSVQLWIWEMDSRLRGNDKLNFSEVVEE